MDNVSFTSKIRIVSPKRFDKIAANMYLRDAEYISQYNLDTCFGGIDFQAFRTKMKEGFTDGVRSCTSALVVAKDKKTSSFMHIFNSISNIKNLNKVRNLFNGNNCILIGGKKACTKSTELFNAVETIAEKSKMPTTVMSNMASAFEANVAYTIKNDTMYLCVKDIFKPENYAKTVKDLKLIFKKFKLSKEDSIIPFNPIKETFENLFNK